MSRILLKNGTLINEGKSFQSDILIVGERIEKIAPDITDPTADIIDAAGKYVIPGMIDDQVHFREPGLTHKADIYTESQAAVAGGITSFMEMPNTKPPTTTQALLEEKYALGAQKSIANYSFFMGATNDNLDEVMRTDRKNVCGIKVFMGSSTGNMLVDNETTLTGIFSECDLLIATHCEDEATVRRNLERFKEKFGENIPAENHPLIRSEEACYLSSSMAVELAKKYNTRLHVLHISTAKETGLFDNSVPLEKKRITAEACVHHLWFTDADYKTKGNWIKWNPAVKTAADRDGIWKAINENRIDIFATDHAPHTIEEKQQSYVDAPSGGPLVQHAVIAIFELVEQGRITRERAVEKMAHAPATCFRVVDRGFLREGYFADIVLVDPVSQTKVDRAGVLSKCGWSPFEGYTFKHAIDRTFVNGALVYEKGKVVEGNIGKRLTFY
jgi:dihydroorotase